jgi:hypothetical protein
MSRGAATDRGFMVATNPESGTYTESDKPGIVAIYLRSKPLRTIRLATSRPRVAATSQKSVWGFRRGTRRELRLTSECAKSVERFACGLRQREGFLVKPIEAIGV